MFKILGTEMNTASFAMYTFSISVLLQALVVVTMSGAADHGRYRKSLLVAFAVIGAIVTMLFLPVTPSVYLFGSLWAIIGNVCFGASFVLLNSFLPLLVRHHPTVKNRPVDVAEAQLAEYGDVSDDIFFDSCRMSSTTVSLLEGLRYTIYTLILHTPTRVAQCSAFRLLK